MKETIEKIKTEITKQGEENGELGMTVFDDWSEIGSVNGDESIVNVSQPRSQYKQNQNQNNPVQIVMSDDEEEEDEEDPAVSIDRLSSILNK